MSIVRLLSKVLAEKNGWPREYAEGYAAGQALLLEGNSIPSYAFTQLDAWTMGFRAGHYNPQSPASLQSQTVRVLETA